MPGLDIGHIFLILGISLLVFGPERLRDIARTLGQTAAELRNSVQGVPELMNGNPLALLESDTLEALRRSQNAAAMWTTSRSPAK